MIIKNERRKKTTEKNFLNKQKKIFRIHFNRETTKR